jgi:hypothetical protein
VQLDPTLCTPAQHRVTRQLCPIVKQRIVFGKPRTLAMRSKTLITRRLENPRSISVAKHSRVKSSMILTVSGCPNLPPHVRITPYVYSSIRMRTDFGAPTGFRSHGESDQLFTARSTQRGATLN